MKFQLTALVTLCYFMILFSSCDRTEIDSTSIYWKSNSLTRMRLNGHVKSVAYNEERRLFEFNRKGYVTKSVRENDGLSYISIYNYDLNDRITTIDFSSNDNEETAYTTTFEYANSGLCAVRDIEVLENDLLEKFVIRNKYHILVSDLMSDLKSITDDSISVNYFRVNDSMLVISNYANALYKTDTVVVKYKDNYPQCIISARGFINDISYSPNGMYKSFVLGKTNKDYSEVSEYYFKPDNRFLLIDSVVHRYSSHDLNTVSVDKFIYDVNKNIVSFESLDYDYSYSYQYDSHDNWTVKTFKYRKKGTATWSMPQQSSRTITYW